MHGLYPFSKWQEKEFIRDRYALRLPTNTPAGDFDLRLSVLDRETPLQSEKRETWLSLGTIHVHATDRLWEPPELAYPVGTRLGEKVELIGYNLSRLQAAPGESLHLSLVGLC